MVLAVGTLGYALVPAAPERDGVDFILQQRAIRPVAVPVDALDSIAGTGLNARMGWLPDRIRPGW